MPQAAGTLQEAEAHAPPEKASKLGEGKANFVAGNEPVKWPARENQ